YYKELKELEEQYQNDRQVINGGKIVVKIAPEMNALVITVMLSGSVLKTILMVICYRRGTASCRVLAMDMRNDIATTLVAVVCATIGSLYWKYADPVGGILVWMKRKRKGIDRERVKTPSKSGSAAHPNVSPQYQSHVASNVQNPA
ncbi:hypothetical protein TELCIR_12613, partial [Teladorsagia circumcincta]